MPSFKAVALVGLAGALVGLATLGPAATSSRNDFAPTADPGPIATASGGSAAALVYPSIVNVRLVRTAAALARATAWVDQVQSSKAVAELTAARTNMTKAWTAAKYVIVTTPPPVATGSAVARSSGAAPAGPSYASPEDTAFAVFNLQHDVVTTSLSLMDAGNATLTNTTLPATISAAIGARRAAMAYIHSIPAPPVDGDAVAGWATVMPSLLPLLDDEIQELKATRSMNPKLPAKILKFLSGAQGLAQAAKTYINTYWPPVTD